MSVGFFPAIALFLWALGLIGNALWAASTLIGGVRTLLRGDRKKGRETIAVGAFLTGMFVVSGLIFLVLWKRWVKT